MKTVVRRLITDILLCIFAGVFLVCGYELAIWARDNFETQRILTEIGGTTSIPSRPVVIPVVPSSSDDTSLSSDISDVSDASQAEAPWTLTKDIATLKLYNSDTRGWIKVAGLEKLDYPFVQNKSDTYYLYYNFEKKKSQAGWVYADNDVNFDKWKANSLFLGHARRDGSMFGSLHNCFYSSWYKNADNHYVYLTTETDELIFQIFSVYHTDIYSGYDRQNFTYEREFASFLNKAIASNELSSVDYGATTDDIVITLTTCNGGVGTTLRVAVHAKLVYSKNDPSLDSYRIVWPEEPSASVVPPIFIPSSSTVTEASQTVASSQPDSTPASSDDTVTSV